ncbi:family 43 glycosylhydrolase [Bacteroides sp.]|uniref:family 43 glycosylhydrolase n=1 Tax=Bacteroides sp. TaxID=29523 RepID=UPI002589B5B2|nr:family 43 glycosylhydrolase [Bacteroides sp.]
MDKIKIYFLFTFIWVYSLPVLAYSAISPTTTKDVDVWAVTATAFKLVGEKEVRNVKLNWMQRKDTDLYKIYRDGNLIGETKGGTFDDYSLPVGKSFTYYIEAFNNGQKIATAASQKATTFMPTHEGRVYDNLNGKYITKISSNKPQGIKIGDLYFSYKIDNTEKEIDGQKIKGWLVTESYSKTGLNGSWSTPRELAFYPNVKMEGNAFRYNPKTGKVVLSSHYEDENGYTAAKIYLAQITPKGKLEVGTMERPLGHDSRDQSLFIDDDNTAYLLSATNTNKDINIYKLDASWTKPVELVNTICKGLHRETPAIIKKDGEYYFFSSKASGWYPSQTMYTSTTDLAGEWTPMREIGNNTTFDAQFNRISKVGTTYGVWSYHWGAQRKYKTPDGNFPRISIAAFNKGYASMDYYRYLEFNDDYGIIPVQNGKNLTLNVPVTSAVSGAKGVKADCITDGASLDSSTYFQKSSNATIGTPYMFTIDMQKKARISEINLSTRLVNGSEAAYKYTIEGSPDGKSYKMLVDGRTNWQVGFLILNVEDPTAYRYLRLRIYGVVNIHKGNSAMWADGIYEFAAFGTPE